MLELSGAPQIVAFARDATDAQILSPDPEAATASWVDRLPPSPARVVADIRAVRALLADESGRSWLAAVDELSLALPDGEESALLVPTTTALEPLGLRAKHVEHITSTIVVLLTRSTDSAASPLADLVVDALVRAASEAASSADEADRAQRSEALALSKLRAAIDRETARVERDASHVDGSSAGVAVPVARRKQGRWARALRDPKTAARRVLGKLKRRLT